MKLISASSSAAWGLAGSGDASSSKNFPGAVSLKQIDGIRRWRRPGSGVSQKNPALGSSLSTGQPRSLSFALSRFLLESEVISLKMTHILYNPTFCQFFSKQTAAACIFNFGFTFIKREVFF